MVAPGGVHSDFRHAFPVFFETAEGCHITDTDGNTFVDYHNAFGAILLGHRNHQVIAAVRDQLERGDLWGMGSNQLELDVAQKIVDNVPSAEKVRFCNSGSEATYHALRLARAYTKRRKIVKFEGSYSGWHDYLDIGVFPSIENIGKHESNSDGILDEASAHTIVIPYNDIERVEDTMRKYGDDIAAVVVEPILHSCGCILPKEGFLETLREITEKNSIQLIFDEVITGFRHSLHGAQGLLGITPDLTVFAKAIANGFPAAAVCGIDELMNLCEPVGRVHVAGTFSGHPISMAAAKATIEQLEDGSVHEKLTNAGDYMRMQLTDLVTEMKLPAQVAGFRSIFAVYFTDKTISNYRDLKINNNDSLFRIYCTRMQDQGIFIPPQAYKRSHIGAAHSQKDLEATLLAARSALDMCRIRLKQNF
jgi:glutamate-1-semialdehyde 2,1-aminomutase